MTISLSDTGKRYNREWIFRHCNYTFHAGKRYAITGSNGSGKSTLLQVIAGATLQNEGQVLYTIDNIQLPAEAHYRHISIAAPYLELVEEMTAREMMEFHAGFKPLLPSHKIEDILELVGLATAIHKQIRYFSSGMKQRLKLAQAFFSDTPVLLLDEPTTNLDADGIALYQNLISNFSSNRLVIISSNVKQEYDFCEEVITTADYK